MCRFLHGFWHFFEKLTPQKLVFWTIHEGYPENIFMNPKFFRKSNFIAFFGHFFSKNCQNFLKRLLRAVFGRFAPEKSKNVSFFWVAHPPGPVTLPLFDPWSLDYTIWNKGLTWNEKFRRNQNWDWNFNRYQNRKRNRNFKLKSSS